MLCPVAAKATLRMPTFVNVHSGNNQYLRIHVPQEGDFEAEAKARQTAGVKGGFCVIGARLANIVVAHRNVGLAAERQNRRQDKQEAGETGRETATAPHVASKVVHCHQVDFM